MYTVTFDDGGVFKNLSLKEMIAILTQESNLLKRSHIDRSEPKKHICKMCDDEATIGDFCQMHFLIIAM